MKIAVAAKKINGEWEGALVVDNKFQRALVAPTLEEVLLRGLVPVFALEGNDTALLMEVTVDGPDETKERP